MIDNSAIQISDTHSKYLFWDNKGYWLTAKTQFRIISKNIKEWQISLVNMTQKHCIKNC